MEEEGTSGRSSGWAFAERQLRKHGWKKGKGLGKRENGISEAVKVKVKCDTAGVGHNSAEQFTFHWWDHLFNSSAANIAVEAGQDGVSVKRVAEQEGAVSNKKPRKAHRVRDQLYGRFVKAATLTPSGEEPSNSVFPLDSSDEDEKLDLSTARRLTDEELVQACGGRTAHKGARHGCTMSAKLARLQEQENAFLADVLQQKVGRRERGSASGGGPRGPKRRRQKAKRDEEEAMASRSPGATGEEDEEEPQKKKKKEKKRKQKRKRDEEAGGNRDGGPSAEQKERRKAKREAEGLLG